MEHILISRKYTNSFHECRKYNIKNKKKRNRTGQAKVVHFLIFQTAQETHCNDDCKQIQYTTANKTIRRSHVPIGLFLKL